MEKQSQIVDPLWQVYSPLEDDFQHHSVFAAGADSTFGGWCLGFGLARRKKNKVHKVF